MKIVIGVLAFLWACVLMALGTGIAKPSLDCDGGPFCRTVDYTPLLQNWIIGLAVVSALVAAVLVISALKKH
jgi:hypothetical protein